MDCVLNLTADQNFMNVIFQLPLRLPAHVSSRSPTAPSLHCTHRRGHLIFGSNYFRDIYLRKSSHSPASIKNTMDPTERRIQPWLPISGAVIANNKVNSRTPIHPAIIYGCKKSDGLENKASGDYYYRLDNVYLPTHSEGTERISKHRIKHLKTTILYNHR